MTAVFWMQANSGRELVFLDLPTTAKDPRHQAAIEAAEHLCWRFSVGRRFARATQHANNNLFYLHEEKEQEAAKD